MTLPSGSAKDTRQAALLTGVTSEGTGSGGPLGELRSAVARHVSAGLHALWGCSRIKFCKVPRTLCSARMIATIIFCVASAFSSPTRAQVAPNGLATGSVAEEPTVETPAEALAVDAAEYAQLFDVPTDEALRRLRAQEASVPLTNSLSNAYADRLAGVFIEHQPVYRVVISVTGLPATETQVATAPFGVPVVVRSGALATRDATLEAIAQHQGEIRAALSTPPALTVDPQTGALLILSRAAELIDANQRPAVIARLAAIAGVPIEVRSWDDVDVNLSALGGERLLGSFPGDTRLSLCTAGFVVTDGTRTALATAAHCPDELVAVDPAGSRTPLTMIGAWGAAYQDVQIHLSDATLPPLFYADDRAHPRLVETWRNRASTRAGDVVCHRGERSGYSCGLVTFVDFAPAGDLCAGPCPATWVAVSGPKCKGGDSGGPVFLGSVAFGLVKGESADGGTCKLYYYMSTDYLPPGWTLAHGSLDGSVATGPPAAPPLSGP